ncbi:YopX family protein [Bacteroides xylanisolvens]|uniref:YopX family protein n=1 Tax=Bacteroides xylanisolvens TaxID=371601 RepID=UPI001F56CF42|nr:YopX family protein [Bacteroides xylanisolvens]
MNRTIKFRGKSADNGKWITGYYYHECGNTYIVEDRQSLSETSRNVPYVVIPETVGQFTGLFDKNGKEIYEGDILHTITFGFEPEEYTAIILYDNCRFQLSNGRNLFYFGQSDLTKMDDTIVIGNIYDNPELIIP